jgi:hypothetical protein
VVLALVVLLVGTALELGVASTPGLPRGRQLGALVALATAKAATIALVFMGLRREAPALRLGALGPLLAPGVYALALMADAAWRYAR